MNPLAPIIPRGHDTRVAWEGMPAGSTALAITTLAATEKRPIIVIASDIQHANQLRHELEFFRGKANWPILHFPDWETLAYDHFSPHEDLISQRLHTLSKLQTLTQGVVITALPTVMHKLLPPEFLTQHAFLLQEGETLNLTTLRNQLSHAGYNSVEQVMTHGEYAIRGSILDIFPMGTHTPFRIELFDDKVESIRSFDPDTQRSIEKMNHIELLPAREYPLNENGIGEFRTAWREAFSVEPMNCPVYQGVSNGEAVGGVEYYLPLFFGKLYSFFDYCPKDSIIVTMKDSNHAAETFWHEVNERYEQLRYDITRPLCAPRDIFLPANDTFTAIKPFQQIVIDTTSQKSALPKLRINHRASNPLSALNTFLENNKSRILFCAESSGRRETLCELLRPIALYPKEANTWPGFLTSKNDIAITVGPLETGFMLEHDKVTVITETELFGEHVMQRRLRSRKELDPNLLIKDLTELNIGSPVVHVNHGVGRYQGLETITTDNIESEYLHLEYAAGDKIYVPVTSLHLISRYTGVDADHAPLQKLGSKQWQTIKDKTIKRIRDVAAELLKIYSEREATPGFAFPEPSQEFLGFREAFPFEETADQSQSIDVIIQDMTRPHSMDRLVCGDVGFGKTEVAMQAAFLATQGGKQIAVLVPTTLLATQHGERFQDRFADWPIKIAVLSRMSTPKEQASTIEGIKKGTIDIVIGTHKLLSEAIQFKDLGLLIVDEEHRFGVRQKERIKALRAHVDILTLTATPIPRTLNMSLAGTRDLSLITTPPARRLAVKTFTHEYKDSIIKEALLRETLRGGQVYFLHNEVATIQAQKEKLAALMPEARITIAHGQMGERELEKVMSDFYHQKYNVLLCTTIIESGIDIPSANTIIINRADKFGLAQLHQIRGRVGRSHHQAYAYLLTPDFKALSKDAKKRLEAICSLEELGAGFHLATHDLEIRGAGELLGEEQSGHMEAIGFSLYLELLEEAVQALKEGKEPANIGEKESGTEVDLHISALIPKDYVFDIGTRLSLYKRLSSCDNYEALAELKAELIDRFGTLPEVTNNLFKLTKLKIQATPLGIKKIDIGKQFGYITFGKKANVDPKIIVSLIQKDYETYQLQGASKLRFVITDFELDKRLEQIQKLLIVLR